MATYPGGVFSPAAKATGNVIQAAHVNDLDTEVTAIEDALLNGLAHAVVISTGGLTVSTGGLRVGGPSTMQALNAGASTLASLSVTGGSTVGTLQAGASTLATLSAGASTVTDLTVTGTLTAASFAPQQPAVYVTKGSSQTVANDTWTCLNWLAETRDSTAMHSTAVNSSRVALTSSGWWSIGGQVAWAGLGGNPSTLGIGVRIIVNDTDGVSGDHRMYDGNVVALGQVLTPLAGLHYASDTASFLTLRVWQNSGGNASVDGSTGSGSGPTQFWALKVSA